MSRLPRTRGLHSRPFPGPWAFAQAAPQAAQVRLSSTLNYGGTLRPSAGLLQCLHPLPVQGRPKRAVPSTARHLVFDRRKRRAQFDCPSRPVTVLPMRRPEGSLRLRSRSALASLRLPAAPAGSGSPSPASAATARRTPFNTLPTFPPRLAGLVGLQRLADKRPNPPSRPERPTTNCHHPARTRPPGTLALAKFENKTTREQQRLRRRCGCSSLDNSLKIRTFVSAQRYLPATSELKSCNPYEDPGSLHPDQ